MLGPPGSGKGTQAKIIANECGIYHISTGDCLRTEMQAGSDIGKKISGIIASGGLVSDDIVNDLIMQHTHPRPHFNGCLFDGYPRTKAQAVFLDQLLSDRGETISVVIDLDVDSESLVQRILERGKSSGRLDDTESVIRKRLEVYESITAELKVYYQKQGKLQIISGIHSIEDTASKIQHIIDHL
ncbi:adenylate kinase [Bacteroidia bacterium]|nr:adenylate kinase [Bacteroidia bacterium]